jgi:hypothetical protein
VDLAANPNVVAHPLHGRGGDPKGTAGPVDDDDGQTRGDDACEANYGMRHGPTVWRVTRLPSPLVGQRSYVRQRWRLGVGGAEAS